MRKLLTILSVCGLFALSGMVFYPMSDTFAKKQNRNGKGVGEVRHRQDIDNSGICVQADGDCTCLGQNKFTENDKIWFQEGDKFKPNTEVHIYVVPSEDWDGVRGRIFDFEFAPDPDSPLMDVSGPVETSRTDINGDISCEMIWANPSRLGTYDIVVDLNNNGIYDDVDAVCRACFDVVDTNALQGGGPTIGIPTPPGGDTANTSTVFLTEVHALDVGLNGKYGITAEIENLGDFGVKFTAKAALHNPATGVVVANLRDKDVSILPHDMGGLKFIGWNDRVGVGEGLYRVTVTLWANPLAPAPFASRSALFDVDHLLHIGAGDGAGAGVEHQ